MTIDISLNLCRCNDKKSDVSLGYIALYLLQHGRTPLHYACFLEEDHGIENLLIKAGANQMAEDKVRNYIVLPCGTLYKRPTFHQQYFILYLCMIFFYKQILLNNLLKQKLHQAVAKTKYVDLG